VPPHPGEQHEQDGGTPVGNLVEIAEERIGDWVRPEVNDDHTENRDRAGGVDTTQTTGMASDVFG
jgi:hypothetical protein